MIYKFLNTLIIIFSIGLVISVGNVSAETDTYVDSFDALDSSKWVPIQNDKWAIVNGTVTSNGGSLIFKGFDDLNYISTIDLTATDSINNDFMQIGFYLHYIDLDEYVRIDIVSDNRGKDIFDSFHIYEPKGSLLVNTQKYINTSTNTSIEIQCINSK